jgi:hypothetical protein
LKLWEERFPIRLKFNYSRDQIRRDSNDRLSVESHQQNRLILTLLTPFIGMLPAPDQLRLQNSYGIPATRMTFLSALMLLLFGGAGMLFRFIENFGGNVPGPESIHGLYALGPYFFCESLVRLYSALKQEHPVGSLPISFIVTAYRTLRNEFDPEYQRSRIAKLEGREAAYQNLRDEIHTIDENNIEVISELPKPHWNLLTGINYDNNWYGLIESGIQNRDNSTQRRYRFILRKASEGIVFRTTVNYSPDEIQNEYKKKKHQDLSTWVDTFSIFWGLLDRKDQEVLHRKYGFDAMKFTKWTTLVLGWTGLLNLAASVASFWGGVGTFSDLLWAIASIYLILESLHRRKKWQAGSPSGSLLGFLLKPLAAPLLRQ